VPVGVGVGGRLGVHGGDRGLELVGPERRGRQGVREQRRRLGDGAAVPSPPVLLGQRHETTVIADPRLPPGVGEQHEREQPGDLPVAGVELVQPADQAQRLRGEVEPGQVPARARRVALVEDHVEDVQGGGDALVAVAVRQRERPARGADRRLGPADALGHRRFGHQEGPRDLRGRQPADRAEGQRDPARFGQRGVGAQQQQVERVVGRARRACQQFGVGARGVAPVRRVLGRHGLLTPATGVLAAPVVGEPPAGHGHQPGDRFVGDAVARPAGGRREQRLLDRVLAEVEPAVPAHQRAEDQRRTRAQQVLDERIAAHDPVGSANP
jgi:hypothetical protein